MQTQDLLQEFPRYMDKIHALELSDRHFKDLLDEYHKVDHLINRYESGAEIPADDCLDELRMERLFLKDELYKCFA